MMPGPAELLVLLVLGGGCLLVPILGMVVAFRLAKRINGPDEGGPPSA